MKRLLTILTLLFILSTYGCTHTIYFDKKPIDNNTEDTTEDEVIAIPNNEIWYTSTDERVIIPQTTAFNTKIASITYTDGKGVITFDEDVTQIGDNAFLACNTVTSITIPYSVTKIGVSSFRECNNLTKFIGKFASKDGRLLVIGEYLHAFAQAGLTQYSIPEGIRVITAYSFYKCKSLEEVTIPSTLTEIGDYAFYGCENLTKINCEPVEPPTLINDNVFYSAYTAKIYVYEECVDIYKKAWAGYANKIVSNGKNSAITTEFTYVTTDNQIIDLSDKLPIKSNTYSSGLGTVIVSGNLRELPQELFKNCKTLKNITLPNTILSIKEQAFSGCSNLTSIIIPDSVTSIENSAFQGCDSLTSVTIPDSVTEIGDYTFYGCSSLTSVAVGSGLTQIGYLAFYRCNKLSEFNGKFASEDGRCLIIDGVLNSFAPAGLTEYTIPDSVTKIGDYAFLDCDDLTSITIPDSVTSVGGSAFDSCVGLTSITIPNSITEIGNGAFQNCNGLEAFYGKFVSSDNRCLTINNSLIAFAPSGLTTYTIPESITEIGFAVFYDCNKLTNITIPNSVKLIGNNAFDGCTSLKNITIPGNVIFIGYGSFAECNNLINVFCKCITPPHIDSTLTFSKETYYTRKFYVPRASVDAYKAADGWNEYADAIEPYDFPETGGNTTEMPYNEIWYTSINGSIIEPYKTNVFGANIISNTYKNGKGVITFDGELTEIGYFAFNNCDDLTSITIPSSVIEIGERAFVYCDGLTSITIPESIISIGSSAFEGCTSLTNVTIPNNNIASIGNYAFSYCHSLTSITIPNSVTEIGDSAFRYCSNLTSFYGKYASEDNRCLIVDGVLNSFAPSGLTQYTIPEGVTSIGNDVFYRCETFTSITIPNSVTRIGDSAFSECLSLTSLTIPNSVTEIGINPFQRCGNLAEFKGKFASVDGRCLIVDGVLNSFAPAGLTTYSIPDSVTKIGDYAFLNCDYLTSITIPNSITEIGDGAFDVCTSIKSITISSNVTSVGYIAFAQCFTLVNVFCERKTPPTANHKFSSVWRAFDDNAANRKIYVPRESVNLYKAADGWKEYADAIEPYDF